MKILIAYGIWNKQDMMEWIVDGLTEHVPAEVDVLFMFDDCKDDSIVNFENAIAKREDRNWICQAFNYEVHEIYMHNFAIDYMLKHGYDCVIAFQDDMKLTGSIIDHTEKVLKDYANRIGIFGGRDGYDFNFKGMQSSEWSESVQPGQQRHPHGTFVQCKYCNPGPMFFPRTAIEKVGKLDVNFRHFFVWDDLCCRCLDVGLINGLLSTRLEHKKFGKVLPSTYYNDDSGAHDRALLSSKNPNHWPL